MGESDVSPAFVDATRTSVFVGTNAGQVFRLQTSDGSSVWATKNKDEAFCTATDTRSEGCDGGAAITSGFFKVWTGTQQGNVVFVTADGHLRMITPDGALVWKTATPIAGASFPLALPELAGGGRLYVGSSDGKLHELNLDDGTEINTQVVGAGTATVGSPVYDVYANELYVGTGDGTLYHYALPF